jgi:hypothetical protein
MTYKSIKDGIEAQISAIDESENEAFVIRNVLMNRQFTFENAFRKLPKSERKKLRAIRGYAAAGARFRSFFNRITALYGRASPLNLLMNIAGSGDLWIFPSRNILVLEFVSNFQTICVTIDADFGELIIDVGHAPTLMLDDLAMNNAMNKGDGLHAEDNQ